jgi:hypothetical protein
MMSSLENKIDTSSKGLKKVSVRRCREETTFFSWRCNAQKLVDNGDAPASLLDPLQVLLNATMRIAKGDNLLRKGVQAVNKFFGEWKTIEHTELFNEELVEAAWVMLASTYVESIPAPIFKTCPGTDPVLMNNWKGLACGRILSRTEHRCSFCSASTGLKRG